jgi:hypothetical protein
MQKAFLRPRGASEYLRRTYGYGAERWLAKLRVKGGGPIFRKVGRLVVYTENDLNVWAKSRLSAPRHSTSESPSSRRLLPKASPKLVAPDAAPRCAEDNASEDNAVN